MAQSVQDITLEGVTICVRLPRALPLRIWIAKILFVLGARVIGCGVRVDTEGSSLRTCSECGLETSEPEGSCLCPVYHTRGTCPIFVDGETRVEVEKRS